MPTKRPLGGGQALVKGLIWLLATLLLTLFLPMSGVGLPGLKNSNLARAEKNEVLVTSPKSTNPRTPPAPDEPPPGPTPAEPTYPEFPQTELSSNDESGLDPDTTEPDLAALDAGLLVRAVAVYSSRGGDRPPMSIFEPDGAPAVWLPTAPPPEVEAFSIVPPEQNIEAPPVPLVEAVPEVPELPQPNTYAEVQGEDLAQISEELGMSMETPIIADTVSDDNPTDEGAETVVPAPDDADSPQVDYSGMPPPPPRAVARAGPPDGTVFRLSFYCLAGSMSSGKQVYYGAAAADASVFPLGTVVEVAEWGIFVIEDRFGWDAGQNRLDIWVPSCAEAIRYGIKYAPVSVIGP